jgi:hypothetical protein
VVSRSPRWPTHAASERTACPSPPCDRRWTVFMRRE